MTNIRKILTVLLWTLLTASIVAGFLWFRSRNRIIPDPLRVLPERTALIFRFRDLPSFLDETGRDNRIRSELMNSGLLDGNEIPNLSADSLFRSDSQLRDLFTGEFIIAAVLKANSTPGILFCLPEKIRKEDKILLAAMEKHLKGFSYAKRRFEGHTIYDLSWTGRAGTENLSITSLDGVITGSFSPEIIEETLREYKPGKGFSYAKEFADVNRTAGNKVPVNIFINYSNANQILKYFTGQEWYRQNPGMADFASWGELDAEFFSEKMILNGFSSANTSGDQELSLIAGQEPAEIKCPSFLPDGTAYFKAYGITDREKFTAGLRQRNRTDKESLALISTRKELLKDPGIDIFTGMTDMLDNEFGISVMQAGKTVSPFFFMKLKSQSIAEQTFRDWIRARAAAEGRDASEYSLKFRIDNYNTFTVYKLPIGGIPGMVFGKEFNSPVKDYFTFLNNYIVFGNTPGSLKEFVYQVTLGNTLAAGNEFRTLGENISSRSGIFIFSKPAGTAERAAEIFDSPAGQNIIRAKKSISKFSALSIQFSAAGELVYGHIFLNFSGESGGNVNTVWESRLDTSILQKPAVVINHLTGEKEIILQDQKGQLYLITKAGIILWKIPVDGPVMSDLLQVDYYRNGKLQYLFNTREKIYLVDRNGNAVEKFPLSLRSPATAGLSVFDYEKDGSLRICIPCEDHRIYMYDRDGKVIPGWKPEATDNIVTKPVQYFRVAGKDYIVAADAYKFYILDRKGSTRVNFKDYFPVSENNIFYLDLSRGDAGARLVTTDVSGNIMRVWLSGKVEKILERKLPAGHFFVYADINGDKRGDYITAWDRNLQVLSASLDEKFSLEFDDTVSFRPVIYNFSSTDNKIGIVLKNRGNIYLYNDNGSLYKGFPLEGYSPFSISSFPELGGKFNLIVGSRNNFLLNYSVK